MPDMQLDDYDLNWHKNPRFTDMVAVKRMVSEMIAQSVDEYRQLTRLGIITGNKISKNCHRNGALIQRSSGYRHTFEIEELISFFDKNVDLWVSAAGLGIEAGVIKSRL